MLCEDCVNKSCLKTGKPCDEVEAYLKSQGIFSREYIRPRVSPKRDKKDGIGKWREIPKGDTKSGLDNDYAGDIE